MVNSKRAYTYLINTFSDFKKSTNGWYTFDCPYCGGKGKAAVNFDSEVVKCWKCEHRVTIVDMVCQLEGMRYMDARNYINSFDESDVKITQLKSVPLLSSVNYNTKGLSYPEGFVTFFESNGSLGRKAKAYVIDRGFKLEVLDRLGFGYCNEHNDDIKLDYYGRIIVPYKQDGILVYYIARDFMNTDDKTYKFRYKNPPKETVGVGKGELIFNEDALQIYDTIFISEGWADAMTFGKYGTATAGWSLSKIQRQKYVRSYAKNIILVPDAGRDDSGTTFYKHAVKLAIDFIDVKDNVIVLDLNGLGSDYGKDANEIGYKKIKEVLVNTEPLNYKMAIDILSDKKK